VIEAYRKVFPLQILDRSVRKGLGRGNLGVIVARAGVGKTACLIHVGLNTFLASEKVVHVSLEETPEKVGAYYKVILHDLAEALKLEKEDEVRAAVERNRIILAYLNQSFTLDRLWENLKNLAENVAFQPATLVVDGLDFEKAGKELFEGFKALAAEFQCEAWFAARSHRHISEVNARGIPYPCSRVDDLFSIIVQLETKPAGVFLRLLKDHESPVASEVATRLDPKTFLAVSG
jgi:hypothetical protein